jgi:hypothetical protein
MAKKTDTTPVAAPVAAVSTRKMTPKVTNVVKRMTPEEREVWFTTNCAKLDADTQKIIREKMGQPLTIRKANGEKSKGMDYNAEWVASLSLMQVLSIKTLVDANIPTREEEKSKAREELKAKMEALKAQEAALV